MHLGSMPTSVCPRCGHHFPRQDDRNTEEHRALERKTAARILRKAGEPMPLTLLAEQVAAELADGTPTAVGRLGRILVNDPKDRFERVMIPAGKYLGQDRPAWRLRAVA